MSRKKIRMAPEALPENPSGLLEIPGFSERIGKGNETPTVRIRFGPVELLEFSDVDFQRLSHRSILRDAGEKAEKWEILPARR